MKITDLRVTDIVSTTRRSEARHTDAINTASPVRNAGFLRVETDEGITGIYPTGVTTLYMLLVEDIKGVVIGEDPFDVERIWEKMYWYTFNSGRRGFPIIVMSSVDNAIWDLLGKACNKPLHKMLGGHRDQVAAYAAGGYYEEGKSVEDLAEEMADYVKEGFKAVKMKVGGQARWGISIDDDVNRVKAVREAIGDGVDLMVDANNAWSPYEAIRFIQEIKKYRPYWFEEPIMADDIEGYVKLCAATDVPIATGESHYTKYEFKELVQRKAVDIVQADPNKCGGITEWKKIAAIAEAWNLPLSPHGRGMVCVNAPLVASTPNGLIVESMSNQLIGEDRIFIESTVSANGWITPSSKPGLGIEINEKAVARYKANWESIPKKLSSTITEPPLRWPPYA